MPEIEELLAIDNRPYDPIVAGKRPREDPSLGRPPRPDTQSAPSFSSTGPSEAAFPVPAQLKDFLSKSIEEYKKLTLAKDRANAYLTKLRAQRAEGLVPNSLKVKPPKVKVSDTTSQANLELQLNSHAEVYRQACLDSLIQAQATTAAALVKQHDEYYALFAERRRQLIHRLADLHLILVTSTTWTRTLRLWDQSIACQFRDAVNAWAITQSLKEGIKATAYNARQAAQEAAMEDAEALPREEAIRHFIRKEIASVLRLQFDKLSRRQQPKNGQRKKPSSSKPPASRKPQAPKNDRRNTRGPREPSQSKSKTGNAPGNRQSNSRPPPRRNQGRSQGRDQAKVVRNAASNPRPPPPRPRRQPSTPSTAQPSSSRRGRSPQRFGSGQQQRRPRSQSTYRSQTRSVPPPRRPRFEPGASSGSRY